MYVSPANTSRTNIFGQTNVINASPITQNSIIQYGQNQSGFMQQQNSSMMQQQQQQQQQISQQYSQQYSQQQLFQQQTSIIPQQQLQYQQNQQVQQFQQLPDQNQQPQQLQNSDPNALPTNYANYGQQQQLQPIFVIPEDYTNPDAVPQKIDFQFYGIVEKIYYVKAYLLLRFQNWQLLFHCNHTKRAVSESEAKIIIKNFLDFQQLEFDALYIVRTEEGYWIVKISDLDRVYMVFYDSNFRRDLAYQNFEEYYKIITEQEQLVKVQDNVELFNQVTLKLQQLTEQCEQKLLENRETNIVFDIEKTEFQQVSYQVALSQQCLISQVEKIKLKTLTNQIHPAFQGTNLLNDLKSNIQPIVSICICILLILIVILLLYNYVIKDVIQAQQSPSPTKKHVIQNFRNQ